MRARFVTTVAPLVVGRVVGAVDARAQGTPPPRPPIIDMHLHADAVQSAGSPPPSLCGTSEFTLSGWDPRDSATVGRFFRCRGKLFSPATTDEALMRGTL